MSDEKTKARIREIISMAYKLNWLIPSQGKFCYPTMQLSEVEKCMSAMIDELEYSRMRLWIKEAATTEKGRV